MILTKRDPDRMWKLTFLTLGFYSSYWLMMTGIEFFEEEVIDFPSSVGWKQLFRYQLFLWPVVVASVPVSVFLVWKVDFNTSTDVGWAVFAVILLSVTWIVFLYPWYEIRGAIHKFIGEDFSIWHELSESFKNGEPIICFWQRKINREIDRRESLMGTQ